MGFCARQQQLFNLPTATVRRRPSSAAGLLGRRSSRRPSRLQALQVTASTTTNTTARPSESEVICLKDIIRDTKLPREGKFFELEMTVRDCELDVYGVVNNAVYASYMETARQEMVASLGVCTGSIVRAGRAMFVVMLRVVQIKGVRMLMEHLIATLPDRKLVLEATATVVCLSQDYRPTRMFPEMARLLRFFSHPDN